MLLRRLEARFCTSASSSSVWGSPKRRLLLHMRHQELWRAVGTQYGPTRIYWPTGHAIRGTAQQALRELLPQITQPGLGTTSDDYGSAATCRSMDLAASAGARATRMSRLWTGDAAGGRGPERRRATGPTTTRPPGAGLRVSLGAPRDSERALQVNSTRHALGIYCSDQPLIRFRRVQSSRLRLGNERNSN
jgi:hypothetical protein